MHYTWFNIFHYRHIEESTPDKECGVLLDTTSVLIFVQWKEVAMYYPSLFKSVVISDVTLVSSCNVVFFPPDAKWPNVPLEDISDVLKKEKRFWVYASYLDFFWQFH